jgi:hypothetical protein
MSKTACGEKFNKLYFNLFHVLYYCYYRIIFQLIAYFFKIEYINAIPLKKLEICISVKKCT